MKKPLPSGPHLPLVGIAIAAALAIIPLTTLLRHPVLIPWRPWPLSIACLLVAVLGITALLCSRRRWILPAALSGALAIAGLGSIAWQEWTFARLKHNVLSTPEEELRAVGRHLMVGYGTIEEIEPLVTKAAVSGVFVSRRNASNKDFEGLAWEIRILQELRARNGLPPLWIAGDQEGGIVSSLSPPLTRPRALRSLLADAATFQQETTRKAQELSCLGINVNLAPVVDLNRGIRDPSDRYSRIADRSISADPEIVSDASATYCSILAKHGVRCTLKHFPGLGRLAADTHVGSAVLPDLEQSDLAPFRNLTNSLDPHPWVMLSHVTVASLDPRRPASGSAPVIDILRRDWQFEGVLVTDDAHMAAYQGNLESNLVGSLSGGVDLVLVAYDPDLTYTVLAMLLRAYRTGQLGRKTLLESDRRLERHRAAAHIGCTTAAD